MDRDINKIEYSNNGSWPENLNVLERYVEELIKNQNKIIDVLDELDDKCNK
jgi:hypothetical protein